MHIFFDTLVVNTNRDGEVIAVSPQTMREILLARTVSVIAQEGMDKTTTKAIVAGTGINEAYIYRLFSDKSDLLSKTFDLLDEELVTVVKENLSLLYNSEIEEDLRFRMLFDAFWNFLLGNREKCLAFVRYYYSPYFSKYSAGSHRRRYVPLISEFSGVFREEADVWMILNHVLNVMLDFAVKVHLGQMSESDDYVEHVFRVVYVSVKQYFKSTEEIQK